MTDTLSFTVYGTPAPQGSKTAVVVAGKPRLLEGRNTPQRDRHRAWRQDVTQAAWVAMTQARRQTPILGPVQVELLFRLRRPKSAPVGHRWHSKRPDSDKLARSCLDALTVAGAIGDDSQVADLHVRKVLCAPGEATGCDVTVRALAHTEAPNAADTPHTDGDAA